MKGSTVVAFKRRIRTLKNFFIDVRFGGQFLGGGSQTRFAHLHANDVCNTDYTAMAEMLRHVTVTGDSVIADVGCGRGRVINYLLSRGLKCDIIGNEIDPDIARATAERLRRYTNVTIVAGSIIEHWPSRATIFYDYNSFGAPVVEQFCDRLDRHPRPFVLLYYNPVHLDIFKRRGFAVEFHAKDTVPAFRGRLTDTDTIHDFCVIRTK